MNGCGIACMANLLGKPYNSVKKDFESKFYTIERGVKIFDIVNYLKSHGLQYKSKFFNQNPKHKSKKGEADKFSRIENSITIIVKNKKYPTGHYLLKTKKGWVDPWYDFPSIDNVRAVVRSELPGKLRYVLYPVE